MVIQLFNILASAGLGLKIIDIRDTFFETIYTKLMRVGKESNVFRIPQDSKIPMITVVCSVIIILLYFCNFNIIDGELAINFSIIPFEWYTYDKFINILRYIKFLGDVLLLYFSYVYSKKNIELLLIPAIIKATYFIVYGVYRVITGYSYNITEDLFLIISFVAIFIMILLVINNKIKNKIPIVIGCLIPIGIAIILCIKQKNPFVYFVYSSVVINLSLLISFIAYCVGYAALVFALDTKEIEECY